MSREIKFRGLRLDGKGWVYGYYSFEFERGYHSQGMDDVPPRCAYISNDSNCFEVDVESVGQLIVLKDKNGVDIYEGDKLLFNGHISTVVYNVGNARFEAHGEKHTVPAHKFKLCEIVGSINENKD
jgi:hypothetical protein